jgi:hypothetical protein
MPEAGTDTEVAAPAGSVAQRPPGDAPRPRTGPTVSSGPSGARPSGSGAPDEDNAALTFQVARPHHLWMHARGVPGTHVVVPLGRGEEVGQETLLDAAHLALQFSRLAASPGARSLDAGAAGEAGEGRRARSGHLHRREGPLVRVEPARIERLLRSREDPSS